MLALLFVMVPAACGPTPSMAQEPDWHKGFIVIPQGPEDFSSHRFKRSLRNLADTNANFVNFLLQYTQSSYKAADIHPSGNTPTDASLVEGIRYARSLGLRVALTLHVGSPDVDGRALINPPDREGWFQAYEKVLLHYADIAQANGVELMVIGAEMIKMTIPASHPDNTEHWREMIRAVRQRYSGKLTYSANWGIDGWLNEKDQVEFWDELDYIGIAAYFNLSSPYTMESLLQEWDHWNRTHIMPLQRRYNKPVLFTEVGYRSADGNLAHPWNYRHRGGPDQGEQADGFQALFAYWRNFPFMHGVHLWYWDTDPNAGGPGTTNYTPQRKEAQEVIAQWFDKMPVVPAIFAAAKSNLTPVIATQPTEISLRLVGTAPAPDTLVSVELYDASGRRVLQRTFQAHQPNDGEGRTYVFYWVPPEDGEYTIKVGVFSSDWSVDHFWEDKAGSFQAAPGNSDRQAPSGG